MEASGARDVRAGQQSEFASAAVARHHREEEYRRQRLSVERNVRSVASANDPPGVTDDHKKRLQRLESVGRATRGHRYGNRLIATQERHAHKRNSDEGDVGEQA